jgi:hypothetical protein
MPPGVDAAAVAAPDGGPAGDGMGSLELGGAFLFLTVGELVELKHRGPNVAEGESRVYGRVGSLLARRVRSLALRVLN